MSLNARGALSIKETCQYLSLGRTSAYELINAGQLTTIKHGRRRLIRTDSVEAWLDTNTKRDPQI